MGRKIRLSRLNLPVVGGDTRHGRCYAVSAGSIIIQGKAVVARFDGGRLSSDGGLLALRRSKVGWDWPIAWPRA
jgi:hypothetical protein